MTMNPNGKDLGSKKEEGGDKMTTPASSSSRQWSSTLKNPRIVRVSRNFGGKDRHSKVCTVRGLRDRRIRLSVPTAIQLYDLQDRLGLSQPSKVIDWLINATKLEIDKLPPLPNFLHYLHPPSPLLPNNSIINPLEYPSPYASHHHHHLLSPKERVTDGGFVAQNFFPLNTAVPNLAYNNSYLFQLETAPDLSLSQFGGGFSFLDRTDQSSSQIYTCPSSTSIAPAYATSLENDHFRQINHFINSPIKSSFSFNASIPSHQNEAAKQDQHRSTS